jgi:hypothetical protein
MDLSRLKNNVAITKIDSDYVGKGFILPTAVYDLTINLAYLSESAAGSMALNIEAKTSNGQSVKNKITLTSRTDKGGKNTYINKTTGVEAYLPGYALCNTLSLLTTGKELGDLGLEEKTINAYSYELKKEIPTKVQMYTDLVNVEVKAGIEQQIVDKNVQNEAGNWVPGPTTREQNEIVKFFRSRDSMTVTEITAQAEEAAYIHIWAADNVNVVDKSTKTGVSSGAPSMGSGVANKPAAASGGVKSLFA